MKVLEARFHPWSKNGGSAVVVGRIRCGEGRPLVEPIEVSPHAIRPFDGVGLIAKLRFLVESTGSNPCDELVRLRSNYWSFVEVNPGAGQD